MALTGFSLMVCWVRVNAGVSLSMVVSHLQGCVGVCVNVKNRGGRCEVLERAYLCTLGKICMQVHKDMQMLSLKVWLLLYLWVLRTAAVLLCNTYFPCIHT